MNLVTLILGLSIGLSSLAATEPSLKVGDLAPPLKIERWLQGEVVARFKPGRVYVVEFWATWCQPCLKSIPHLNELSRKYGNRLDVIGVAADESPETSDERLETVRSFMRK